MWESVAVWPPAVSTGNDPNISTDKHAKEDSALAVCKALREEGLGGEGKIFPLETYVREMRGHDVKPLPDQQRMTDAEYVKWAGGRCPICRSYEIEGDSIEVGNGKASQKIGCNGCGRSWLDSYRLTGYYEVTEGDHDEG